MKAPVIISAWELLLKTAEVGTVAEAAARLGLTLSKASRLMAALEDAVGAPILDRTVKPARLTETARQKLPDAELFLRTYLRLLTPPHPVPAAPLRVSIPANAAPLPVLAVLNRFETQYDVQIDLLNDCGVEGLLSGKADVAWFGFEPTEPALFSTHAYDLYNFLMATPAYLKRWGTPKAVSDLARHTILMRDTANRSYDAVLTNGTEVFRLDEHCRCRRENAEVCRARLLAGEGIALDLTPGLMMNELAAGTVVPVLPGWHRRPWPIVIAALKERLKEPLIETLHRALVECARHMDGMNDWKFWYRRLHLPMPTEGSFGIEKRSRSLDDLCREGPSLQPPRIGGQEKGPGM